jgi:hypothetical protein
VTHDLKRQVLDFIHLPQTVLKLSAKMQQTAQAL